MIAYVRGWFDNYLTYQKKKIYILDNLFLSAASFEPTHFTQRCSNSSKSAEKYLFWK